MCFYEITLQFNHKYVSTILTFSAFRDYKTLCNILNAYARLVIREKQNKIFFHNEQ